MVDITPPVPQGRQFIHRYGDGGFFISEEEYRGAVLVTPEQTYPLPIESVDQLTADMLSPATVSIPDDGAVLLLGTGPAITPISKELRAELRSTGVAIELMDSGAACRTFNVLLSEERAVIAVLLPVE